MDRATAPSPAAPRRRGGAARALLVAGACAASACALNQKGVTPPADTFFYPASAIADPTARWLFVTNSNADLRYNDGTLVMVDLDQAKLDRTQGGGLVPVVGGVQATWELCPQEDYVSPLDRGDPQICCWDRLDHGILNCDERRYVQAASTVAIGSFAAGMVWQPTCTGRCDKLAPVTCTPDASKGRLLIGVRGDTSLTWVDVDLTKPNPFDCGQPAGGSPAECSAASRIIDTKSALVTEMTDMAAPPVPLPDEPYALALDSTLSLLYVGHLVGSTSTIDTGGVSLFDVSSSADLSMDNFISPFPSPFPPNSAGSYGITALKLHVPLGQSAVPGAPQEIFASSRYVPLVTAMVPFGNLSQCPGDVTDEVVEPAGDSFNSEQLGSEMRGIEFIDPPAPAAGTPPPAERAYALQRVPPYLVGFGISTNQAGGTSATPTDLLETCSSPTFLYQHDAGAGTRLYVSCFDTGEVYVFDPTGPTLETIFQAGRGPAGIVFPDADPTIAYLIGFSDNNVSVLDLAPGSATQYHVIQRLGFPSVTPR